MSPRSAGRWLNRGAGLALLSLLGQAAHAACAVEHLDLALGAESSHWQEENAAGERLLEERGTLRAWGVALAGACEGWQWVGQLDARSGTRDYQGRSSNGAALSTQSRTQGRRLQLQAWRPMAGDAWAFGMRTGWEPGARRDLASVGPVLGYEERRDRWRFGLGARWRHPLLAAWSGQWEAWLDSGPRARLSLQGDAFGAKTVTLDEGRWQSVAFSWMASPAPQPGRWQPWLGWRWEALRTRAGEAVGVQLDSGRLLAVSQPAYRQTAWQLLAGLRYSLD